MSAWAASTCSLGAMVDSKNEKSSGASLYWFDFGDFFDYLRRRNLCFGMGRHDQEPEEDDGTACSK